jgi:hypothetical protein
MNANCTGCGEPILPHERLDPNFPDQPRHWECGLRSACGGVNHMLKQCSCCGGSYPPDPESLTRRQAAKAAAAVFGVLHP